MCVNILDKSRINREFLLKLSEDDKILIILKQEEILKEKDKLIEEKDKLIKRQEEEINNLKSSLKDLENKSKVKKTCSNSSISSSRDYKKNKDLREEKDKETNFLKKGHCKGGRELKDNPDRIVNIEADKCNKCGSININKKLISSYEKIVIPKIRAENVRVNLYECYCKNCSNKVEIEYEKYEKDLLGRELLSDELKTQIVYLRYQHNLSYQRIVRYLSDIYGIKISQGLITKVINSMSDILNSKVEEIKQQIKRSDIVFSDETSVRVKGKTCWEWIFANYNYVYHLISNTRSSKVKEELFSEKHPDKYVSDGYYAQRKGVKKWQICLAHQIRDCKYLIDLNNSEFGLKAKELFKKAISYQNENILVKKEKKQELLQELEKILNIQTTTKEEEKLKKRFANIKESLFMFLDYENVPSTNNMSEQIIRKSVIFRKITNCFRSDKGKEIFANLRSLIDTSQIQGKNIYKTISELFSTIKLSRCQYG